MGKYDANDYFGALVVGVLLLVTVSPSVAGALWRVTLVSPLYLTGIIDLDAAMVVANWSAWGDVSW